MPRIRRLLLSLPCLLPLALPACGAAVQDTPSPRAADTPAGAPAPPTAADRPASPRADFVQVLPGTVVEIGMVALPDGLPGVQAGWIGRTEVTWDAYDVFVHRLDLPADERAGAADGVARPSQPYVLADYGFGHDGNPVISVSHQGASAFCAWLSARTGRRYRLPTEAEWRAICEAARTDGDVTTRAWVKETSDRRTHPVGRLAPDALGLHDLLGNATEWCTTADGEPVALGGCYLDAAAEVGCAARKVPTPAWNMRDPQIPKSPWWLSDASWAGFRVVCETSTRSRVM